ncbi:Tyrosine-protein phosphatase non-receptor type 6 [Linnemannia exigua]|uniref:Tyrosine-protein phosphatase non-receptor type 6 n=1 Tax=Linnemannia exigua TaxID=604196 RepID=A0AAD4HBS3_9FUNG|nr:Tyrosine-protein phosphatase non-receptor type 6 [Linnemannia exigua]
MAPPLMVTVSIPTIRILVACDRLCAFAIRHPINNIIKNYSTVNCNKTMSEQAHLPAFLRPESKTSQASYQNKAFEKLTHQEYNRLDEGQDNANSRFSLHQATQVANRKYNRYNDILPFKHSQVVVNGGPQQYINANRITSPPSLRSSLPADFTGYIATQAPLPETQATFWRMVKEQNVHVIVCLTAVDHDRKRRAAKAEQYWPQAGLTDQFGTELSVRNLDSTNSNNEVVYRNLELWDPSLPAETPRRPILLVHYQGWPDHGVPRNSNNLRDILYTIRSWKHNQMTVNSYGGDFGPMVVHCSAGCGRTGTFCVIDTSLSVLEHVGYPHIAPHPLRVQEQARADTRTQQQQQGGAYDWNQDEDIIFEALDAFRKERMLMVQTPAQYQFCYGVVRDLCQ